MCGNFENDYRFLTVLIFEFPNRIYFCPEELIFVILRRRLIQNSYSSTHKPFKMAGQLYAPARSCAFWNHIDFASFHQSPFICHA